MHQKYAELNAKNEASEARTSGDEKAKTGKKGSKSKIGPGNAKKKSPESADKAKNMATSLYRNGNGLPQQVRAEIIRNIIKNFNLEKYISQFKAEYIVEIELDKKYGDEGFFFC